MATLAPRSDKIMKRDNETFPNLFATLSGPTGANSVLQIDASNALFSGNIECENIQLNESISLQGTGGKLTLSNVVTSATAGSTGPGYLQVVVNGTLRKISLLNAT
jgi:hypothetical protein